MEPLGMCRVLMGTGNLHDFRPEKVVCCVLGPQNVTKEQRFASNKSRPDVAGREFEKGLSLR